MIGKTVRINDFVSTIIGVVQRAPHYPQHTDMFVNIVTSPHHLSATMATGRTHRMTEVFGRLADNATRRAGAGGDRPRLDERLRAITRTHTKKRRATRSRSSPLQAALNERASLTLWLLMGAATFVLLIACANVANLTLMRGVGREREMLVRAALGAGSWRLRRLLLVENLTLALVGGALGVLVAFAGLKMLVAFAAQLTPRADEIRVDGLVLAVSLVTSVAAAIAALVRAADRVGGARWPRRSRPADGGRRRVADGSGCRTRSSWRSSRCAWCCSPAAGLLVRTMSKLQSVETGVRAENVLDDGGADRDGIDLAAGKARDVRADARQARRASRRRGGVGRRRTCRCATRSSCSR